MQNHDEMGPKRTAQYEEFERLLALWLANPHDRIDKANLIRNIKEPIEKD